MYEKKNSSDSDYIRQQSFKVNGYTRQGDNSVKKDFPLILILRKKIFPFRVPTDPFSEGDQCLGK